ncbi:serine/threonine protein kinase [Mycobacterium eburneum]|nr:serine/threonine-protein kinase PknD [Mycobacterium eburneum]TDH48273.1 serine/threonine protein kinase [Mycobacterium eburneum]
MSDTGRGSRVGSQFGPYRLLRLLGRGGMGEVYEAEDTRKGRVVALKLISEQFSGNPVFRARMQREADAAGRLTEPHVVPIHDYGEIGGLLYLDMRLIDGTDLSTLLKRYGPLSPPRAVAIVRQIASALDAAHAAGVTHRDVKPENILITGDDFAYLVDFGIARAKADPGLTQTGMAMGTYNYMAPERFTSDEITPSADIYSLACVLCECLTGSPPYRAETIERMIGAHLTAPAPQPSQLRPGRVPPALDAVIARGMAKKPAERYRSAGELAAAAHDALDAPEQNQAATILRQGEDATLRAPAIDPGAVGAFTSSGERIASPAASPSDATRVRPVTPPGEAPSWRSQPQAPPARQPAVPPSFARGPEPEQRRRKMLLGAGALLLAVVVAVFAFLLTRHPSGSSSASGQSVMPFEGLNFHLSPAAVALDNEGNVYAASMGMYGRVVKLAAGSDNPTVLPFTGLYQPQGLAVDSAGAVYVSDFNNRVVKLASGSNNQMVLPFNGLNYPEGVAVDAEGNVYVADRGNDRVVKLAAGSNTQSDLPFNGLNNPDGVTVGDDGSVYVADTDNNRVLKLPAGSTTQAELPFTNLSVPWGVGVDNKGNVYVTEHDNSQVLKLAAGANSSTVLPFTGLNTPLDVVADNDGNVYVADRGNNRVVKLAS